MHHIYVYLTRPGNVPLWTFLRHIWFSTQQACGAHIGLQYVCCTCVEMSIWSILCDFKHASTLSFHATCISPEKCRQHSITLSNSVDHRNNPYPSFRRRSVLFRCDRQLFSGNVPDPHSTTSSFLAAKMRGKTIRVSVTGSVPSLRAVTSWEWSSRTSCAFSTFREYVTMI